MCRLPVVASAELLSIEAPRLEYDTGPSTGMVCVVYIACCTCSDRHKKRNYIELEKPGPTNHFFIPCKHVLIPHPSKIYLFLPCPHQSAPLSIKILVLAAVICRGKLPSDLHQETRKAPRDSEVHSNTITRFYPRALRIQIQSGFALLRSNLCQLATGFCLLVFPYCWLPHSPQYPPPHFPPPCPSSRSLLLLKLLGGWGALQKMAILSGPVWTCVRTCLDTPLGALGGSFLLVTSPKLNKLLKPDPVICTPSNIYLFRGMLVGRTLKKQYFCGMFLRYSLLLVCAKKYMHYRGARLFHIVLIWHAELWQPNSPEDLYWESPEEDSGPLNPPATVCEKILKRRVEAFVFIAGHGRGGVARCFNEMMWL